jgi:hypothetical protein
MTTGVRRDDSQGKKAANTSASASPDLQEEFARPDDGRVWVDVTTERGLLGARADQTGHEHLQ